MCICLYVGLAVRWVLVLVWRVAVAVAAGQAQAERSSEAFLSIFRVINFLLLQVCRRLPW
jgi:hypothetical protein